MKIIKISKLPKIPAGHEDLSKPGVFKKIIYTYKDLIKGGRIQMVNWAILPVNSEFRAHYHQDLEEIFIIIKGQGEIIMDHEKSEIGEGETVLIPVGTVHMMRNIKKDELNYIVIGITKEGSGKTIVMKE